ncbi:MAG: hypothetical protein DDT26_02678 [Dehalococcoidia bacterium]|nr:hypothetical protein [Chloroflexota bacterium]
MIRETTMNTLKSITDSVSLVPFTTDGTELRGMGRVFLYKPSPCLLTFLFDPIYGRGIKPMRQPPIKLTRKLSSCTRLDTLEALDTKHPYVREVDPLQAMSYKRLNFNMGMFLPFGKCLNALINFIASGLPIREYEPVLVVRVHPYDNTRFPLGRSRLFENKVDKDSTSAETQPDCFSDLPTISKTIIDNLSGMDRNNHSGSTRASECNCKVEAASECLHFNKVRI